MMTTKTTGDITRLAFAVLFVTALGVTGSFLQTPSESNVAAVVVAQAAPWVNPDTQLPAKNANPDIVNNVTQSNPDARRGGQDIPWGSTTGSKDAESETKTTEDALSTSGRVAIAPARDLLAESLASCDTDGSGGCKNLCSTSFITPLAGGYVITDCYVSKDPKAPVNAVLNLQQCIERETGEDIPGNGDIIEVRSTGEGSLVRFTESPMKEALCIGNLPKLGLRTCESGSCPTENTVLDPNPEVRDAEGVFVVPKKCEAELGKVIQLRNLRTAQSSATHNEALVCANKGPAVCYPKDFSNPSKGYFCVPKDPNVRGELPSVSTSVGSRCPDDGFTERIQCRIGGIFSGGTNWGAAGVSIGQAIGQGLSQLFYSNRNTSSNSSNPQSCTSGYVKAVVDGRTVCKKESATLPQCLLVASKESILAGETVTVRWRTTNAEEVNISGIGSNLPKSSETTIRPSETTKYELIAIGSGSQKKMCEVTVVVEGGSTLGPTGSSPPQFSCTPGTLLKGRASTIKWACTAAADGAVGKGIDIKGKLAGEVTVTPDYNTEYSVTCFNGDDEIGKNSCAVEVGQPVYDIIVEPIKAGRGDRVRVAWSSLFMNSCNIKGPRGFDYKSTQGVVVTEPFSFDKESVPDRQIRAAIYTLECNTQFGTKVTKDVTVDFKVGE